MKNRIIRITAAILMLLMLLSSCAPATQGNDVTTDDQTTEAPATEAPANDEVYIERPDKEVKKILMIGNSFCYYFTDELYGIASADGYDLTVANLYKSGCLVSEHWMSGVMKAKNESTYKDSKIYELYTVTNKGRKKVAAPNFDEALAYDDWDVITLQQHFYPTMAKDYDKCISDTKLYAGKLFDHVKENNPEATLYWHETWAYQVGFDSKGETIADVATQTLTYENIKKASTVIAEDNEVPMIPSADAWQLARADARVGDVLCADDFYHDGDVGGGQYLNACVWYEVLMGESCIGNTWRPSREYTLSEEKITALQEAAHAAVAAIYGPGYAK